MASAALELRDLNKTFRTESTATHVLDGINFTLQKEEFVSIIGPSGCGKSTLLKIVAGLDMEYEGEAALNGVPIEGPSKKKGFIFQEHRLFPWLTVEKNIAADLSLRDASIRKSR